MLTGLWLLLFGLPLWFAALYFSPKPGHHEATSHMILFWIGGAMSIIGWAMTVLVLARRWEIHPAIAVVTLLVGYGASGFVLLFVDSAREKRQARS